MNSDFKQSPGTPHDALQALLPGLLAGTLDRAQTALAQRHLDSCDECRADLAWQQRLHAAMPAVDPALDVERAFAQLLPRLGPQASAPVGVLARWRHVAGPRHHSQ